MPEACDGGSSCSLPSQCPGTGTKCVTATCTGGCCGTTDSAPETVCTDNGGAFCDSMGNCVACVATADCTASTTLCAAVACTGNKCVPTPAPKGATCDDGGGTVCDGAGHCVSAQCNDGLVDGKETDVDCGGGDCSGCADGKKCQAGADCADGVCGGSLPACRGPDLHRRRARRRRDRRRLRRRHLPRLRGHQEVRGEHRLRLRRLPEPGLRLEACRRRMHGERSVREQCVCGTSGTGDCCAAACASVGGACGASGCDSTGACIYVAAGTSCGTGPSCSGGTETEAPACDGAGTCAPPVMTACGNFTCNGS